MRGSLPPARGRFDSIAPIDEGDKVGLASFRFVFPRPLRIRAGCGVFVWRLAIGVGQGARRQTQGERPRCGEACPSERPVRHSRRNRRSRQSRARLVPLRVSEAFEEPRGLRRFRLTSCVLRRARREAPDARRPAAVRGSLSRRAAGSTQSTQSTKSTKSGSPRPASRVRGRSGGGRAAANAASPSERHRACAWLQIVPRPKRVRSGSMAQPSMPSSAQAA